jgi:hypothetical protein
MALPQQCQFLGLARKFLRSVCHRRASGSVSISLFHRTTPIPSSIRLVRAVVGLPAQALRARPRRSRRKRCARLLRRKASTEGRDWRGQAMEETMRLWTITELMHLSGDELCGLASRIALTLPDLEVGSVERSDALTSLDNIRSILARRNPSHS